LIAQKSFENRQASTCRFLKKVHDNHGNLRPIGKKGKNLIENSAHTSSEKFFGNSKVIGVKRLRSCSLVIILKTVLKKNNE
jgi:hypothetical protein